MKFYNFILIINNKTNLNHLNCFVWIKQKLILLLLIEKRETKDKLLKSLREKMKNRWWSIMIPKTNRIKKCRYGEVEY